MPPAKKPLTAEQRALVQGWFRMITFSETVRDIGATPLRRLSRYELINTLEDLLHVSLKRPYVFSPEFPALLDSTSSRFCRPTCPGVGFNDADQLASGKLNSVELTQAYDYVLQSFVQSAEARERVFGFANERKELSQPVRGRFCNDSRFGRFELSQRSQRAIGSAGVLGQAPGISTGGVAVARDEDGACVTGVPLPDGEARDSESYAVSGEELAVRLSYFLWGGMPDEELFHLAKRGSWTTTRCCLAKCGGCFNRPSGLRCRRISQPVAWLP